MPPVPAAAKPPIDQLISAPAGGVSHTDLAGLSDADTVKFFQARTKAKIATQYDAVLAGMKLGEKDVPELLRLRDEAQKKTLEAIKAGDNDAYYANSGKVVWYNGAIEGARRQGPNYQGVLELQAKGVTPPPTSPEAPPAAPSPTPALGRPPIAPEGELFASQEAPRTGDAARAYIVKRLEQLEDIDPVTGQAVPKPDLTEAQEKARAKFRQRLGEIEQAKIGKPVTMPEPTPRIIENKYNWKTDTSLEAKLWGAAHNTQGAEERWGKLRATGATDERLLQQLGFEFGIQAGSSTYGGYAVKGEKNPRLWAGGMSWSGKPTLSGKALIAKAREVLEIPLPGKAQAPAPKPTAPAAKPEPPAPTAPAPAPAPTAAYTAAQAAFEAAQKHVADLEAQYEDLGRQMDEVRAKQKKAPPSEADQLEKDDIALGHARFNLDLEIQKAKAEAGERRGDVGIERMRAETAPYTGPGALPVPTGTKTITTKTLKTQKENLLAQLKGAIAEAPEAGTDKITIDVPGDGVFTILNTKEALKNFAKIAESQFPETVKGEGKAKSPAKGRVMPKAVPPSPEDLPKIGVSAVSEDPSRYSIQTGYADGTQIVSTDGRQMLRIVTNRAPGTPAAPVRLDENGKVTESDSNYPNYNQIQDPNPKLAAGGVKTDELWKVARQAEVFKKSFDQPQDALNLFSNPDGSIGARMTQREGELFEYNIQPNARDMGSYNSEYVFNAADVARRLGNERVDLYYHSGTDGPIEVRGGNSSHLIMPMRTEEGKPVRQELRGPIYGERVHGSLPFGLGPLENPEATRSTVVEATGAGKWNVMLEKGQFTIQQHFPKVGTYGKETWENVGEMPLDMLLGNSEAVRRGNIADALKGTNEGKGVPKAVLQAIDKGMRQLAQERAKIIAEGQQRGKAAGPGIAGSVGAASPEEFTARENRRRILADVAEFMFGSRAGEITDALLRKLAGESVPKTMSFSGEAGNRMVEFASAQIAAPHMAHAMTREVLGDHFKDGAFRSRLGAVLVEDRLRAIRETFQNMADTALDPTEQARFQEKADNVNTLVGPRKPFATENDFRAALRDPEITAAIERHKQTVQYEATKFHTEAEGQLAGPGINTGAFVNLAPLYQQSPTAVFTGARRGDYTRPFKRRSVFSRHAAGTASAYELDYNVLAERMIRGNYEEYTKRQLYAQLVKDGLAVVLAPGEPRPTFDGKPAEKFQIKRQVNIHHSEGNTSVVAQYENLWVRPEIAPELRQAENLAPPLKSLALARVANVLNKIQLAGPTDAVWHIANLFSGIFSSQGGKNFLVDLARKVPGVNVVDGVIRATIAARKILHEDPDILRQIAELSEIGTIRPDRPGAFITSRIINLMDKAGRVVRDDMYRNLTQRRNIFGKPLIEASEAGRREYVNQTGQYNPRLMGQLESFFKEAGLAPFIVAGRNFNRAALRRVTLSPGLRAANLASAVQMRAVEAVGILATLAAVPALINTIMVGRPTGRPGILIGALDTGKDDANGQHIYIDPAQWIGLRRGMRLTGINAVVEGMRRGETPREIAQRAGKDIIGAAVHPWAGPAVQAPFITATGYTTSSYRESEDPGNYWENFKAALKNINPLLHGWFRRNEKTFVAGVESAVKSLSSAGGLKTATRDPAGARVHNMVQNWLRTHEDPRMRARYELQLKQDFGPSPYTPLKRALETGNLAKAREEYDKLLPAHKRMTISDVLNPYRHPFAGSRINEIRFKRSLSDEDRAIYNTAIDDRKRIWSNYRRMLRGEME